VAVAFAALVAFVGCNKGTPGGPGVDKEKEKKTKLEQAEDKVTQAEDTFTLSVPTFATKLKQGESKEVTVGIKRGKNFGQDVTLKLEGVPEGVSVEPEDPAIKHSEDDVKLTFKAADDAALGTFTIKVTGHPKKGGDATNKLKITVQKKK
jgi:uncharacterized membrane protein